MSPVRIIPYRFPLTSQHCISNILLKFILLRTLNIIYTLKSQNRNQINGCHLMMDDQQMTMKSTDFIVPRIITSPVIVSYTHGPHYFVTVLFIIKQ